MRARHHERRTVYVKQHSLELFRCRQRRRACSLWRVGHGHLHFAAASHTAGRRSYRRQASQQAKHKPDKASAWYPDSARAQRGCAQSCKAENQTTVARVCAKVNSTHTLCATFLHVFFSQRIMAQLSLSPSLKPPLDVGQASEPPHAPEGEPVLFKLPVATRAAALAASPELEAARLAGGETFCRASSDCVLPLVATQAVAVLLRLSDDEPVTALAAAAEALCKRSEVAGCVGPALLAANTAH